MLKRLPILETTFVVSLLLGIVSTHIGFDLFWLTKISLGGLAIVLFLYAFRPLDIPPPNDGEDQEYKGGFRYLLALSLVPKWLFIGMSIGLFGILLSMLNTGNKGYISALHISLLTITVSILISFLLRLSGLKIVKVLYPTILKSILVIGGVLLVLVSQ